MFPSQNSKVYLSSDWQYGDRRYHEKGWFRPTAFQDVLTLWGVAFSATCLHSALHWLWLLGRRQVEGPCSRRRSSWLPVLVLPALDFFGGGEVRCFHCWLYVCSRAQNGGTIFRPLARNVTEAHTLPRGTRWKWLMLLFCQSFVPPSVDAESTAVGQTVACTPSRQRARVRSPVRTSFLGKVFSGFSFTCKTSPRISFGHHYHP